MNATCDNIKIQLGYKRNFKYALYLFNEKNFVLNFIKLLLRLKKKRNFKESVICSTKSQIVLFNQIYRCVTSIPFTYQVKVFNKMSSSKIGFSLKLILVSYIVSTSTALACNFGYSYEMEKTV